MQELVTVLVTLAAFHFGSGASAGVRRGGDSLVALHGGRWRTTANRVHVIEGLVRVAPGEGSNPSSDTAEQAKQGPRSRNPHPGRALPDGMGSWPESGSASIFGVG
jgi:hypothetical protein